MKLEKQKLQKEINLLYKHLKPLEKKLRRIHAREHISKSSELIGTCYVYRNSYSKDHSWNLYRKITGITTQGDFKVLNIERTPQGIEILEYTISGTSSLGRPITQKVFDLEFKKMTGQLKASITRAETNNQRWKQQFNQSKQTT